MGGLDTRVVPYDGVQRAVFLHLFEPMPRPHHRAFRIALPVAVVIVAALIGTGLAFTLRRHAAAARNATAAAPTVSAAEMADRNVSPGTWINVVAPSFTLRDQHNRQVSLAQFRGKVVVLAFIDSHCTTICPLTTQSMLDAVQLLGPAARKVELVGINANPDATKVSDVAAYTAAHDMQGRWEFLTGSLSQLRQVWQAYHVYVTATSNSGINHTPVFFLIGPGGHERVVYFAQMSYEGVRQQAQIVADAVARLLPGHPMVTQQVALHFVPPLTPGDPIRLSTRRGEVVRLGAGHPHLTLFFADWLDEDTDLAPRLAALSRYARVAQHRHWPSAVVVNEVLTEPVGAHDVALSTFSASAHVPVVKDAAGRLAQGYGVQDLPWFVLTSATGRIIWQHDGWLTGAELVHDAATALAARHRV